MPNVMRATPAGTFGWFGSGRFPIVFSRVTVIGANKNERSRALSGFFVGR